MQTVPERHSNSGQLGFDESSRRYQALLHSADLAAQCTFPELLKESSKSVHDLFPFEFLNYALYSSSRNSMVLRNARWRRRARLAAHRTPCRRLSFGLGLV